jgi:hypothetical protein
MKPNNRATLLTLTFAAVTISSLPLQAADPIETPWNQVCRVAAGHELLLTTDKGDTVEGYCVSVDVNGIGVTTKNGKVVHIARKALSRLEMRGVKPHQLSALRKGVHDSLWDGFGYLLSPWAPVGVVMVPGTLVWGAVATPFCALGDLKAKLTGTRVIKLT